MQSLALKWIVDAAVDQRWSLAIIASAVGAVGAGLLGSAGRAMSDTEHVVATQVGLLVDRNTLELAAGMPGIEHLERPEYLDQLAMVRGGGSSLIRAVFTLTRTASLALSMASSLWLLGAVHPLLLLTPLCAIPTAILVPRSERFVDEAKMLAAERQRSATQLHKLFLSPVPAMELRVFGAAERLDERSDELWREVSDIQLRGSIRSALLASVGWLALTTGYLAALLLTAWLAIEGRASVGDVVLVSQLALLIRGNVARTAEAARRAAAALRTADRFLWLEDLHESQSRAFDGDRTVPDRLEKGIRFENLSFTYPGTDTPVLRGLNFSIPAGCTVAVVGSNGAGKSTIVKLLTRMYSPSEGRILVDDQELTGFDVYRWRARLGGTFQDFLRLETTARLTIGVGDPDRRHDDLAVIAAAERGGAADLLQRLGGGLDSHVGKTYEDGAELSGGQWQRLAIARGMMPKRPLCLILDEPTAALDPAAEQALYDEYQRAARDAGDQGAITLLISHRFSSVRMADLIVVLDAGATGEIGTHDQLMTSDGAYAQMYRRQAAAYHADQDES